MLSYEIILIILYIIVRKNMYKLDFRAKPSGFPLKRTLMMFRILAGELLLPTLGP